MYVMATDDRISVDRGKAIEAAIERDDEHLHLPKILAQILS